MKTRSEWFLSSSNNPMIQSRDTDDLPSPFGILNDDHNWNMSGRTVSDLHWRKFVLFQNPITSPNGG